ncbi:MAG: hypothetical protein B6I25_06460 [Planctomycetales bacterium 4572_13]|nr:MAG: hypothetical protein B6I25_06460 [Planctomycetales bacterium 4572_13]
MIQQLNEHRLLCTLLCTLLFGLICLFGCDKQPNGNTALPMDYAVDVPYEKGPLSVRVRLNAEQVKLSGLITLELSATIESDYEVQFPAVSETLKQFRIRSLDDQSKILSEDNNIEEIYQYQLEPLELGQCEIPALTFNFEQKGSPEASPKSGTLTTEPVWVEVVTSLPADPNAFVIADIDDVVEMKANYFWLWICLGVGCLLAMGVGIGMVIKPKKAIEIRRIYKSAHEIAFEALSSIGKENLVEQGRFKEFYEKLSNCLRQYIENRFQLHAPEQTTEEFLEQLKTSDALTLGYKQELQKFLTHCDLVKFARYQPSPEQINESLTMAEGFVEKTKSEEHRIDVTASQQAERQVV